MDDSTTFTWAQINKAICQGGANNCWIDPQAIADIIRKGLEPRYSVARTSGYPAYAVAERDGKDVVLCYTRDKADYIAALLNEDADEH